jgi:hypothetical protein
MMWGDGDRGGEVVNEGVGGGCMGRVGMLGAGVDVMLASDHSIVLARVEVLSMSENGRLKLLLVLSDEIWDMAMVVVVPVGAKQPFMWGCVCQRARIAC